MKVFIALLCFAAGGLAVPTLKESKTKFDYVQSFLHDWMDEEFSALTYMNVYLPNGKAFNLGKLLKIFDNVWDETEITTKDVEELTVSNPKWKQLTGRVQEEVCTGHEFIGYEATCIECVKSLFVDVTKCASENLMNIMCYVTALLDFNKCIG